MSLRRAGNTGRPVQAPGRAVLVGTVTVVGAGAGWVACAVEAPASSVAAVVELVVVAVVVGADTLVPVRTTGTSATAEPVTGRAPADPEGDVTRVPCSVGPDAGATG